MPDQIFENGPLPAPLIYTVPGAGEVVPLSCQALYDGTGAGGSFLPTLIFRSQAGHVIARVPTSSVVSAGGSAEVTWAPFLRAAAAAAASSSIPFAVLDLDIGTGTFTAGTHAPNITTLQTNPAGASVFSLVSPPTTFLSIAEAGVYGVYGCFAMSSPLTLLANTAFSLTVGNPGLSTTLNRIALVLANTTATTRFQEATGSTFEQYSAGDTARYIFFNQQTYTNVGPLGWAIWQVSKGKVT